MDDIRHSFVLEAPIEDVWNAVATSEGLSAWLMPNDLQAVEGLAFTFRMPPQPDWSGITYCTVLEVNKPNLIAFTWTSDPINDKNPTVVTFGLESVGSGTRFALTHSGWDKQPEFLRNIRDMLDEGWGKKTVQGLKSYLGIN